MNKLIAAYITAERVRKAMDVARMVARRITFIITGRSLLSHDELQQMIRDGVINADPENVNSTSIDITLHDTIMIEEIPICNKAVDVAAKETIRMDSRKMKECGYIVAPGEFLLASSIEVFNLPENISAEYKLKSSQARVGLDHLNAGWCDAGWNNSRLTLEFKNLTRFHELKITPGMKCGQVVFFRHKRVPKDKSYAIRGQYNGQTEVTASKGLA